MTKKSKIIILITVIIAILIIVALILNLTKSGTSLFSSLKEKQQTELETSQVKVGDIVYYNPTAGVTDKSKLTYTIKAGSDDAEKVTTSGNGTADVTYTATASDNKWIVLKNDNGKLTLMSDDLKKGTGAFDGDLVFRGVTGYLYAEQELHNACSIYGYGTGAVEQVSYIEQPKIGSPDVEGDLKDADLLKSGARSMTRYDIEELAGIKTKEDKIAADTYVSNKNGFSNEEFIANFMTRNLPKANVHIPSLSKKGTVSGPNYRPLYTSYSIEKTYEKISQELRDYIFKPAPEGSGENWYWLASRSVSVTSKSSMTGLDYFDDKKPEGRVDYVVDMITSNYLSGISPCFYLGDLPKSLYGQEPSPIRPVVQLKADVNLAQSQQDGYDWEVVTSVPTQEETDDTSLAPIEESLEQAKLGDIVYYNPTAGVTDKSKLTYTSKKGSSKVISEAGSKTTPGNGRIDTTFTATANDNKWVVLKNDNGKLTLMSYDVKEGKNEINKNPENQRINKGLMFGGSTGYLHAEQELHNACSIYGHGKGAVEQVSYIEQPKIGSPDVEGDLKNADLLKSGARSITRYDIEELAGIKTKEDKMAADIFDENEKNERFIRQRNNFNKYFMTKDFPLTNNVHIPVLGDRGSVSGPNYRPIYTDYSIVKDYDKIPQVLKEHIFKGDPYQGSDSYWLASRAVYPDKATLVDEPEEFINYCVDIGTKNYVSGMSVTMYRREGDWPNASVQDISAYPIRPVVQINQNNLIQSEKSGYNWEVK